MRHEDGRPKTVELYEHFPRYVQELDITATAVTATDQGIEPIIHSRDLAHLDWSGIELVDEDWRPAFDGTFTRSRFYRNAKWMECLSGFAILPVDDHGRPVGPPIVAIAGGDNAWLPRDDGFIRRFVARQITLGCPTLGDCTGAKEFIAQGVVQVRNAQHANRRARPIPAQATRLQLLWTEDMGNPRTVPNVQKRYADTPYRYGFAPTVQVITPPANGQYYLPGKGIDVKVTFRDGAGNRLHPDGSLPRYSDFISERIDSGLRYYDGFQQLLTLYYALKHREGLTMWSVAGPSERLKMPSHVVGFFDFFAPQTTMATVSEDGFSSVATLNPRFAQLAVPDARDTPVSNTVHFVIPEDARPGTYVVTVKGRRDWGGEALNRAATLDIQVGQAVPTGFQPTTGPCNTCHQGASSLSNVLHGLGDRRTCYSCHATLEFEPDHALDYRIHLIHSRSDRFAADVYRCATCHLTPPDGPPRGFPGIGPY